VSHHQPRKNLVAALVVAVLLLAGGATAIIALTSHDAETAGQPVATTPENPDTGVAAERDAAVEDGAQAARILNTLDHTTIEVDLDRWESVATGDLLAELKGNRETATQQATAAGSKATGTVLSAALAEFDPEKGTARLLAAVTIAVDVNGTETTKRTRVSVALEKTAGGWKAAGINIL
jgi:Mce-associated membrane protein